MNALRRHPVLSALAVVVVMALALDLGRITVAVWRDLHPTRRPVSPLAADRFGLVRFEEASFRTSDGVELSGWWSPSQHGAAVVLVHGWGANREHAFPCSKCHQTHNSGLPRLMQTNCLDYQHRGNRTADGVFWNADAQTGPSPTTLASTAHNNGGQHRGYPRADSALIWPKTGPQGIEASTSCHMGAPGNQRGYPDGEYWNQKTPWPVTP